MKITLFLMSQKGFAVLDALVKNDLKLSIDKVIVGVDSSVLKDFSDEIIQLCSKNKIEYSLSNQNYIVNTSYALAVSWRWIIKNNQTKIIVLHDSILPKYRGFAPLVNSLINKEKFIGVTALFASDEYDKGPIITQEKFKVHYPIKIEEAISKVSILYSSIVIDIFKKLNSNIQIVSFPQNEKEASYSLWRNEDDYFINWNFSSSKIDRFIDAVGFPYKGAKCIIDGEIVIIKDATIIADIKIENRDVGKVVFMQDNKPTVVCGKGLIRIDEAIFENSKVSIFPLKNFRTVFK